MNLLAILFPPEMKLATKGLLSQPRSHSPSAFSSTSTVPVVVERDISDTIEIECCVIVIVRLPAALSVRFVRPTPVNEIGSSVVLRSLPRRHMRYTNARITGCRRSTRAPSIIAYATRESENNKNKNRTNESMTRAPCCVGLKPFICLSFVLFLTPDPLSMTRHENVWQIELDVTYLDVTDDDDPVKGTIEWRITTTVINNEAENVENVIIVIPCRLVIFVLRRR